MSGTGDAAFTQPLLEGAEIILTKQTVQRFAIIAADTDGTSVNVERQMRQMSHQVITVIEFEFLRETAGPGKISDGAGFIHKRCRTVFHLLTEMFFVCLVRQIQQYFCRHRIEKIAAVPAGTVVDPF